MPYQPILSLSADPLVWQLAEAMHDLSEDHFCAGWLHDIEYDLWAAVQGDTAGFSANEFSAEEIKVLRDLSNTVKGWVMWEKDVGEVFVPINDWLEIYKRKISRK